ncbi:predicted protein [Chaetoceros tenuissimus]|uniref:Uncharacterized protein n=1 Tax=Chaetoceros tenuissimus TaxID=426638 RepID=A0AAD3D7P4_9STRA|nr:predicted protein [Chaetoceros tenuissimus]
MGEICSGCGGRFSHCDKFERLSKIQESRTKADETKGDAGTILVAHCNYCILTHSLYLCNDETTIQRATNKIPEGRNGDRLKLSVDHTIKEVKRAKEARKPKDPPLLDKTNQTTKGVKRAKKAKKPKGPPLLDDKTKQACKILNRALPDFVKNGKGRVYMAKNPGCSAYDYIFEHISPSMIGSVLKSCAPEFMKARGLHDVEEKCQCSRGCKHILPTEESERSFLPVLKGSPIPVAKCCLYTLIWNDDPRIHTSLAKEKKSVKGGMVAYNENNPKGPTAVQLCKLVDVG